MKKNVFLILMTVVLLAVMPMIALANESDGTVGNPWSGRSAVFVGDSITAGVGTTKIYYQYLEEMLDFGSVTAMGVSGSCISAASDYGQKNTPLINRYQNIPSADLIVIFMGTNDYGHETPLGSEEDAQDGTFYGALNTIIPALVEKHPFSKIVFITPIHRYGFGTSKILGTKFTYDHIPNGVGASLADYVEALKVICRSNGVSVVDLYAECTLEPTVPAVREEYIPDGLHPNASGHEMIAGIMESHIREYEPIEKAPANYRWETTENGFENITTGGYAPNPLSTISGSVENGVLNKAHFTMETPVVLKHDSKWVVEWKAGGNWSGILLSENSKNTAVNNLHLYKSAMEFGLIAFGTYRDGNHHNYGLDASEHNIDFSGEHIYRVENRIHEDGTNMAYLIVDGIECGAMNSYYIGGNSNQNKEVDWVSGKDFTFGYIGTTTLPLVNGTLSYISVWECGESHTHTYKNGICIGCGSSVHDAGYTHAVPASQGVVNAIGRAYALTDVEWTPLKDVPGVQKINGEYTVVPFEAGVTYKGIPYSGVTANDCYVGLNVSLESFLTALRNENAVLYTENLFSTNPKSASYFGTVCSKFAQYVLDIPGSYNTNNVANIPGMETVALPGEYTVDEIRLGDVVLDTALHTTVCTDILYDAGGEVAYIEISEAVMPLVRRMLWTPEDFYEHFAAYRLCRYQDLDEIPAVDAVNTDGDYALMPRFGNRYNYKVSSAKGIVDVLEEGYSKAVILRDGAVIDEILLNGAGSFGFDRGVPGALEMYLEKEDGTRSDSVYAHVVNSSVAVTDSSKFAAGKLTVSFDGSSGTPLYVQVGSAHAIFCNVEGEQGTAELTFSPSKISNRQVRVAYQNENGIYLSGWVPFTADENPSDDPLLSQAKYWNGYNITPSSPTPVVQANKVGYWSYTMIPVEENTTYYSKGATRMWFLDEKGNGISTCNAYRDGEVPFQFTTPADTAYVSIAYSPELVEQGTETISCLQSPGTAVSGTVKSSRGAKVILLGEICCETDTSGNYRFSDVAQGIYDLVIEAAGCLTYTVKGITVGEADVLLPEIELVAGDVNDDDMINIMDIGAFRENFGMAEGEITNIHTDVNDDGMVNIIDMGIFRRNFGKTATKDCTVTF